jgi:MYXO-CTERM domain-containing protein
MNKILRIAGLTLCATSLSALAYANRIESPAISAADQSVFGQAAVTSGVSSVGIVASNARNTPTEVYNRSIFDHFPNWGGDSAVSPVATNSVPEGANTLALLGLSALALAAMRRRFSN